MVKRVGKYEIGKTLGEGTFGKVKYAVNTETGEKVAIKILDKEKIQKQNMGAQIKKEISIMKMVKHENVVKLYEVLASRTKIFIVLELITGGELFDKIVADGRFDENTARYYFRQLIKGVKYCHSQGVCHRDLKPENLLLDQNGNLKISDFGLSALYTGSADDEGRATLLHTTCGTPNYVAPEVLNDKGYDGRAADIWSCGVILYVLLAGFLPFDEPHMSALFRKIQKAEFTYPSWFSAQIRTLLDKIMIADPLKRATIADLEADPWFIGPDGLGIEGAPFVYDKPEASVTPAPSAPAPGSRSTAAAPATKPGAKTPVVAHVPSAKDIEDAVEDVPESAVADKEETRTSKREKEGGPRTLNAFEVVNMFGGMALNRLMETSEKRISTNAPQFMSSQSPSVIMSRLQAALTSLGAEVVPEGQFKIKGRIITGRGEITLKAVIFKMSETLQLVEIHRGKGDLLEYNAIHTKLREALADLVTKTSASRMK